MLPSEIEARNRAFLFRGGEPGVLLVHGYLSSPQEMRAIGKYLASVGMTVLGIRLRGHGTTPEELAEVRWYDWDADVAAGLAELRTLCDQVNLLGLSLGGALVLRAAAREPVDRVVACSAPDDLLAGSLPLRLAAVAAPFVDNVPKIGSDIRDPDARSRHFNYDTIPLSSAAQLSALLRSMENVYQRVTAPTLLIQSRNDRVVPPDTVERIARRIASPRHILWVERGGHTVVDDWDREKVFAAVETWLRGEIPPDAVEPGAAQPEPESAEERSKEGQSA